MSDGLEARVEALEERVEELEEQITGTSAGTSSLLDRYDEYVMAEVEDPTTANTRRLMRLYREAGVMKQKKRKQRIKRLRKLEGQHD